MNAPRPEDRGFSRKILMNATVTPLRRPFAPTVTPLDKPMQALVGVEIAMRAWGGCGLESALYASIETLTCRYYDWAAFPEERGTYDDSLTFQQLKRELLVLADAALGLVRYLELCPPTFPPADYATVLANCKAALADLQRLSR